MLVLKPSPLLFLVNASANFFLLCYILSIFIINFSLTALRCREQGQHHSEEQARGSHHHQTALRA